MKVHFQVYPVHLKSILMMPMNTPTKWSMLPSARATKSDTDSEPMVCKHGNMDFLIGLGCEYFGLRQVIQAHTFTPLQAQRGSAGCWDWSQQAALVGKAGNHSCRSLSQGMGASLLSPVEGGLVCLVSEDRGSQELYLPGLSWFWPLQEITCFWATRQG